MKKENFDLAINLRHELHRHPELSNEEVWTKQYLMSFLEMYTNNLKLVDEGNWFYAVYRAGEDQPNIAFRADFDALPMNEVIDVLYASKFSGKAHKCGHDGHSSTLAALALEIDQDGADKNVFFLFQPAEETGDGAIQCVDFIAENNIDEIFAYHNMSGLPYKSIGIINGTMLCASKGMTVQLKGVPAHASQPEQGINPSFAIAKIINDIPSITSSEKNKGLVLCTIVQVDVGEKAFGIAASKGNLRMTIRSLYEDEMDKLQNNLEELAKEQADKYGLQVSFFYNDEFPATANDKESADKVRHVTKSQGLELIEMDEAFRSSEDFGHYTKRTKGAYCFIGNGENYPAIHTSEYDFRDELIETGVNLFKGLIKS